MRLLENPKVLIRLHIVTIKDVFEYTPLPRYCTQRRLNTPYLVVVIPIPRTDSNAVAATGALSPNLLHHPLLPAHL